MLSASVSGRLLSACALYLCSLTLGIFVGKVIQLFLVSLCPVGQLLHSLQVRQYVVLFALEHLCGCARAENVVKILVHRPALFQIALRRAGVFSVSAGQ